jgi:hypothetical protein
VADGSSSIPIQLAVTNGNGQGIPNTPVTFTTTAGTLSSGTGTTATRASGGTSATVTTNASGVAQVFLVAGTKAGTASVRAEAMGFSTIMQVTFVSGIPAQVALRATPSTVGVGTTTTVQATVTTAGGAPVEGVTVTFNFQVNNSGASLAPTSGTTNASGQVTATYTAGTRAGTDTVRGTVLSNITGTVTIAVTAQATAVSANSLDLLVSSPQLDSDGTETITLTALVRDTNNNLLSGVNVTFAADSGGIKVTQGTTDENGRATALLETAGNRTNRKITVTATAGTLTSTNTVNVTGTTLTLSSTNRLVLSQKTTLSILLRDSGGNGIANQTVTISSALGNTLSATSVTTGSNGEATIDVTATVAGSDTIEATALGASGAFTLTVSSANFRFESPAAGAEVTLGAAGTTIVVHWDEAGVNQAGQTINFFATRGTLSATSAVTDGAGNTPPVTITSDNAGPAVITAVAAAPDGPSSQLSIEFIATTPASLVLQASPTSLGVNTGGITDQKSIITAVVRDAAGNLVKNQNVVFTLRDVSGGSIFPAAAVTDSFGRASTVYTAGATPSAQDGVSIEARVAGLTGRVTLTVSQQALFVTLGTGNLLQAASNTLYAKPYSALVNDANGNPIAGAKVEINVFPIRYEKGFYTLFFDEDGNCTGWGKVRTIRSTNPLADDADQACTNEDVNRNGLLNPGEDINNNGALDPDVPVTVPTVVTTDSTGFATFDIVYPKDRTWVEIELEARATVAGSEASARTRFFLPGLASDFNNCQVSPPGHLSPYGLATTCGCDELADPLCPTASETTPPVTIVILAGSTPEPIPGTGGRIFLQVTGGTQSGYTVSTTNGTLTNASGTSGTTIVVVFGEEFSLNIPALPPGTLALTTTITAVDTVTRQQDTEDFDQQ